MRTFPIFLTVLFLAFPSVAFCQQNLAAEAQWMQGASSWMDSWASNAGRANFQAQAVEAQAKLISAHAAFISAQAGANKTNAEALQALEHAKGLVLDNEVKRAKTFYDKRTLRQNYKDLAQGSKTRGAEDYLRVSVASAPQRLTEEQFDYLRAAIIWPSPLKSEEFAPEREQLNQLFEKRLDYPQDVSQDVKLAVKKMESKLVGLVGESDQTEYAKAKRFLRSLAYESQFPTGIEKLASN